MTTQNLIVESPEQMFLDFLRSHNHELDGLINYDSSEFHQFKCPHGGRTDARYKYYSDGIPSAYLNCWHCGIEANFCSKKQQNLTKEEWNVHQERVAADKLKNKMEMQQRQKQVAALAKAVFAKANEEFAKNHDYLCLKHVKNFGLKVIVDQDNDADEIQCYKDTLLVPCYNAKDELVNLERIYFDKKENKYQKRPLSGGERNSTYYLIGALTEQPEIIYLAEGYSSAAVPHEATRSPIAVTFNCGNLLNVAKILRAKYPNTPLLIIADDDRWQEAPKLRHAGLKAAKTVCKSVTNTSYILPDFSVLGLSDEELKQEKPTDINDLFVLLLKSGMKRTIACDIVRAQLLPQSTKHAEILNQILRQITPINFWQRAELKSEEKLLVKHMIIIAIAEILDLAKANNWGICKNHDFTYLYNGEYWSLLDIDELKSFLGQASELMSLSKFNARYHQFKDQLYNQFLSSANLPKPEQPPNTVLINLKNGTFEITPNGGRLTEFNRDNFMTYQLPFNYNPNATAPLFEAYLDKVLPEKDLQHVLAEYTGYIFVRTTTLKLEKALLLYGSGANGKSVFYEILRNLLGEQNTSDYSLESLTEEKGYFRANIVNKLVNYGSDISRKLDSALFKKLASGEPVEARQPYGRAFVIEHYAKLIFNCNELPSDVEFTNAYFRRFLIIPFLVTIPEEEQDPQLAQKIIINELSGVFNWVLMGLNRLLEQKQFTDAEGVRSARKQYELESDSIKLFLEDKDYQTSATDYISVKDLYVEYRTFCADDGSQPVKRTNFKKRLQHSKIAVCKRNIGDVAYVSKSVYEYKKCD